MKTCKIQDALHSCKKTPHRRTCPHEKQLPPAMETVKLEPKQNTKKILMLVDPTQLSLIMLFTGAVTFILVISLSAFFELGEPGNPEPRRTRKMLPTKYGVRLASMEESIETVTDLTLMEKIADILSALPNLEAWTASS
jgi:hypothetical protein